jgi:hypothetical protein
VPSPDAGFDGCSYDQLYESASCGDHVILLAGWFFAIGAGFVILYTQFVVTRAAKTCGVVVAEDSRSCRWSS